MKALFQILLLVLSLVLLPPFGWSQDKEKPPAAVTQTANYILTQNDVVAIRVFREPTLDSQCRISKDGTINFPLLGLVKITGKTTNEAAAHIAALLNKDYIVKPQVSISVVAYARQPFNVLGQVQKPGSFAMPDEQSLDLLSAIAMAGGFTRLADQGHVAIRRQVDGQDQTITVDAKKLAKGSKGERFMILPNDTISVPERFF
jgi:protein involved in polysaccharide export with SLBB domain